MGPLLRGFAPALPLGVPTWGQLQLHPSQLNFGKTDPSVQEPALEGAGKGGTFPGRGLGTPQLRSQVESGVAS